MRASVFKVLTLLSCCSPAFSEPPPRSLDQALVSTLSLGVARGCGPAFGLRDFGDDQASLDTFLAAERTAKRLGNEIAMICGSSAVSSAAALGGSLGSPQTTKTVSQFRMARNRADSRLDTRGKRTAFDRPVLLAQLGGQLPALTGQDAAGDAAAGPGMFFQVDHERRDRITTPLEAGYQADATETLVGMDYAARDGWVAGAWVGYRNADANYRAANLLIGGPVANLGTTLDAALLADICKVGPGGGFDDKGTRFGGFVARRIGDMFGDIGMQYSRRNYAYRRNVCAIESSSGDIVRDPGSVSGFSGGGVAIDDIYAGTISGKARLTEWGLSGRVGFDVDAEPFFWGPRLALTYLRTQIGAFTESGRTSVTNEVRSNTPDVLRLERRSGDPIGLELAYDKQQRTSLQSELQLAAAYRHESGFGTLVPRLSVSWVHEFKGERQLVGIRMAQDQRASPTRFDFTTDSVDKNKGTVALGLSLLRGPQFAADVEVSRLLGDDRFKATSLAARAAWRF